MDLPNFTAQFQQLIEDLKQEVTKNVTDLVHREIDQKSSDLFAMFLKQLCEAVTNANDQSDGNTVANSSEANNTDANNTDENNTDENNTDANNTNVNSAEPSLPLAQPIDDPEKPDTQHNDNPQDSSLSKPALSFDPSKREVIHWTFDDEPSDSEDFFEESDFNDLPQDTETSVSEKFTDQEDEDNNEVSDNDNDKDYKIEDEEEDEDEDNEVSDNDNDKDYKIEDEEEDEEEDEVNGEEEDKDEEELKIPVPPKKPRYMPQLEQVQKKLLTESSNNVSLDKLSKFRTIRLSCLFDWCQFEFPNKNFLDKHLLSFHKTTSLCPLKGCNHHLLDKQLSEHILANHSEVTQWECFKCNMKLNDYKCLHSHVVNYHYTGNFECAVQGCRFQGNSRFVVIHHYNKAHMEHRFVCSYQDCDKKFSCKSSLLTHLNLHREVVPFRCSLAQAGPNRDSSHSDGPF